MFSAAAGPKNGQMNQQQKLPLVGRADHLPAVILAGRIGPNGGCDDPPNEETECSYSLIESKLDGLLCLKGYPLMVIHH